jgi:hypothetical protein
MLKTELQIKSFGMSERGKFEYFLKFGGVGEFGAIVNKEVGVLMCWLLFNFFVFYGVCR